MGRTSVASLLSPADRLHSTAGHRSKNTATDPSSVSHRAFDPGCHHRPHVPQKTGLWNPASPGRWGRDCSQRPRHAKFWAQAHALAASSRAGCSQAGCHPRRGELGGAGRVVGGLSSTPRVSAERLWSCLLGLRRHPGRAGPLPSCSKQGPRFSHALAQEPGARLGAEARAGSRSSISIRPRQRLGFSRCAVAAVTSICSL